MKRLDRALRSHKRACLPTDEIGSPITREIKRPVRRAQDFLGGIEGRAIFPKRPRAFVMRHTMPRNRK